MKDDASSGALGAAATEGVDFLSGRSEMAALVRRTDWATTPLGAIETWPQSLRTTVSLCLASNFPINIIWGPQSTQIYNDGYRVVCGEAHPRALGEPYNVTWASAWPAIGEPFERAWAGETSFLENQRMFLTRNGYLEETFFTFSLSPIRDETGGVAGLFHPVTETTATMLAERRTRALRDLTANLGTATNLSALVGAVIETLKAFEFDLPFVLAYELSVEDSEYRLVANHGAPAGSNLCPPILELDAVTPWRVRDAARAQGSLLISGVAALVGDAPCGPYEEPPQRAFVLPVPIPGVDLAPLVIVVGVSPRLPFDDAYGGFYDLLAAALAAALANVRAREDERRRSEALAEIDRAKTQFFSNVSHEFRTPLTLMLGPLEEALEDADELAPAARQRLEIAHRNGQRLLRLVNSLLDFSRIEAGRTHARFEPVDIAGFTSELASNFRSACERAGLQLVIDVTPLPTPVYVDRDMWEKIVLNLVSNAFKFTFDGEIRVTVRPSQEGRTAAVTVEDTGVGISGEALPHLFERFYRVEGAQGRSYEGSGIGLALVRELVRLHGGEIRVDSAPGEGSAFTVTLPAGAGHLPAEQVHQPNPLTPTTIKAQAFVEEAMRWLPDQPEAGGSDAPEARTGPKAAGRVLLADDNADMRSYVKRLLTAEGFTVVTCADGKSALASARNHPPDLILTDVMMPKLDGFGLLGAVRADPELREIPLILLSARAGEEARIEGIEAGADDYLVKPFSARELVARVAINLNLARDRREATLRALNADLERQVLERTLERGRTWQLSPDLMGVLNREGVLESVNPAWEAVLGWSAAEITANPFTHFVHPDDLERTEAEMAKLAHGAKAIRLDTRVRTKDDGYRWLSMTAVPDDGRIYAVSRDVTAEKEAAEALAHAEEALRQSQKMEAVGQLTGGIAHDFNNMLAVVIGSLDLLTRRMVDSDPRIRRYVDAAADGARRAAQLTQRLLAFSRQQPLRPEAVDINRLVAGISELLRGSLGSDIRLECVLASGLWRTNIDPNQLESVLLNLAVNARDAMPDGGRLTIETQNAYLDERYVASQLGLSAGQYVLLAVTDTGGGMSEEVVAKAFDPFFTTKGVGKGTGLGLSQVYGFVKQSGGHVKIYSEAGQGTTVKVYLPRLIGDHADAPEDDLATDLPNGDSHEVVLVVEDEPAVRQFSVDALTELGYRVLEADGAPAALRLLESHPEIVLLFTDIVMPDVNGAKLADEARTRRPDLRVLFTTGYTRNAVVHNGVLDPGVDLIGKPFTIEELAAKVRDVLDREISTALPGGAEG